MQQPAPVRRGQRRHRFRPGGDWPSGDWPGGDWPGGDWLRQARVGADGAERVLAEFGGFGAADVAAERVGVLRVAGQMVGQAGADSEHGGQPVAEVRLVAQRPVQGLRVVHGPGQAGQPGEREVRVGRGRHRGQHRTVPGPVFCFTGLAGIWVDGAQISAEQALGPRGVRETHPGQPSRQRGPRTAHASKGITAS